MSDDDVFVSSFNKPLPDKRFPKFGIVKDRPAVLFDDSAGLISRRPGSWSPIRPEERSRMRLRSEENWRRSFGILDSLEGIKRRAHDFFFDVRK
ncbi:MAG: hypothetical protein MRY63_04225 [Neomegalonema sp.]|nr:hypothetical protein [Neomegalonema sp.]